MARAHPAGGWRCPISINDDGDGSGGRENRRGGLFE